MRCPHCGSSFWDGEHCMMCGRSTAIQVNSIKQILQLKCKRCGKDYNVYIFYGVGNLDHIDSEQRYYCHECKVKLTSIVSAEYKAEHGMLGANTSPKRLQQWWNYLEYIGEREVQQNQ